ncbi:COP9 signalosome (CSN) subunit, partial [Mortierella sp. 14UC]
FHHNRRLVLHYLIPTRLLHGSLPSSRLLEEFPELSALYRPLALAIKTGNVQLFDEALFLLSDKSNKLNIEQFQRALAFVGVHIDEEEVECMLANMIYRGYIRGYLSHEKKVLVLSQKDPFPGLESQQ